MRGWRDGGAEEGRDGGRKGEMVVGSTLMSKLPQAASYTKSSGEEQSEQNRSQREARERQRLEVFFFFCLDTAGTVKKRGKRLNVPAEAEKEAKGSDRGLLGVTPLAITREKIWRRGEEGPSDKEEIRGSWWGVWRALDTVASGVTMKPSLQLRLCATEAASCRHKESLEKNPPPGHVLPGLKVL